VEGKVNNLDRLMYDRFIEQHPGMNDYIESRGGWVEMGQEGWDELYGMVDYLYKGGLDNLVNDFVETLDEVNAIRSLKFVCKGDAWRSVDTASTILEAKSNSSQLQQAEDFDDEDFKSALRNFYSGEMFGEELDAAGQQQNTIQQLVTKGGDNYTPSAPATEDELKFRNWLKERASKDTNIQEILEFFGAFYAHANRLKRESYQSTTEVTGITLGDNVRDLIPTEMASLAIEELELLFGYNYAMKELQQYDRSKPESGKKGNIVLVMDKSGSMDKPIGHYKKINVALGFAMAVVKALDDDDRNCVGIDFNESAGVSFTEDNSLEEKFTAILNLTANGMTHTHNAIEAAAWSSDDSYDVMVVTDGVDDTLGNKTKELVKNRKLSCLLVGEYAPQGTALSKIADSFIVTNDLDEGFKELMKEAI